MQHIGDTIGGAYNEINRRFGIVPAFALHNYAKDLGATAFAVYCALCVYSNNETDVAWPSYQSIGDCLGIHRRTVMRCVGILEKQQLIKRRGGGNGRGDSVRWYIVDKKGVANAPLFKRRVTNGTKKGDK